MAGRRILAAAAALGFALLALAACTGTLSPEQCQATDWRAIGISDGAEGRPTGVFRTHQESCAKAGIAPDQAAWSAGYLEGLKSYCQPYAMYKRGRNGASFPKACEGRSKSLNDAWAFGRRYWDISREMDFVWMDAREPVGFGGVPSDTMLARNKLVQLRNERRQYAHWPPR